MTLNEHLSPTMSIEEFLVELAKCGLGFQWFDYCGTRRIRTGVVQVPHHDGVRMVDYHFCPVCAVVYSRRPAPAPRNHVYWAVGMEVLGLSEEDCQKIAYAADGVPAADKDLRRRLLVICGLSEPEGSPDATLRSDVSSPVPDGGEAGPGG